MIQCSCCSVFHVVLNFCQRKGRRNRWKMMKKCRDICTLFDDQLTWKTSQNNMEAICSHREVVNTYQKWKSWRKSLLFSHFSFDIFSHCSLLILLYIFFSSVRAHLIKVWIVEDTCKQTNHGNILLQVKISREKFQRVQIFASTNFSAWLNHKIFRGTKFIKWSINCKFAGLIFASDPEPREISSRVNFYQ